MMLLHIASRATSVTHVEPVALWLGGIAIAVLGLAIAGVLWRSELSRFVRLRTVTRALRLAAPAILLAAVLPSVVPYDHLFLAPDESHASEAVHEDHCHGDAGSCSDAPLAAGAGLFLVTAVDVAAPAMLAMLILIAMPMLRGGTRRPDVPPPLRLSLSIP